MIFDKNSIDYKVNIWSLHAMEEVVPMTLYDCKYLRKRVRSGYETESNTWGYNMDSDGMPLNYLQAYRLKYGYSIGPLVVLRFPCFTYAFILFSISFHLF